MARSCLATTAFWRLLVLLGLVGACGRAARHAAEATPAAQAKAALTGARGFRLGHVSRALQPITGKATAASPYSNVELTYRGLRDGKVCFSFPYVAQYFRSRGAPEQVIADRVQGARAAVMTFALREELDDADDWASTPPASQIGTARLLSSNMQRRHQERGPASSTTTEWLETTIEVCGAAPPGSQRAEFLTAVSYPGSPTRAPALFVWQID